LLICHKIQCNIVKNTLLSDCFFGDFAHWETSNLKDFKRRKRKKEETIEENYFPKLGD